MARPTMLSEPLMKLAAPAFWNPARSGELKKPSARIEANGVQTWPKESTKSRRHATSADRRVKVPARPFTRHCPRRKTEQVS